MENYTCYTDDGKIRKGRSRYNDLLAKNILGRENWGISFDTKLLVERQIYAEELSKKNNMLAGGKRVFISHRQQDSVKALRIASVLQKNGIYYWLDVLDSTLANGQLNSIQLANHIEMALLNCTHVVALMTDNSKDSQWIPYEFGRVRDRSLGTSNAASYRYQLSNDLPEYMETGDIFGNDVDLMNWVNQP